MVFSTYLFIFIFLPITLFGYRLLTYFKFYSMSRLWLVLASLYFYAQGSGKFLFVFLAVIFFNYFIGLLIIRSSGPRASLKKSVFLSIGLAL